MTPRPVPEWIGKTPTTPVPERVVLRLLLKQDGKCACGCGRKFSAKDKPEADHIKALTNGGENQESNLQLMLPACHRLKTNEDVAEKSTVNRLKSKHLGIRKPKGRPMPGTKRSRFKKFMDGRVGRR